MYFLAGSLNGFMVADQCPFYRGTAPGCLLGLTIVQNQNMERYMTIILIVLLTVIFYFENSVSVTQDQFVFGHDLI